MSHATIITVPGYLGSGPAHWQTWMEQQLPQVSRVTGIDWSQPVLAWWASSIRQAIQGAIGPVYVVAHSFGCLASVVAIQALPGKVAGALLVAPASPARFDLLGLQPEEVSWQAGVAAWLPDKPLPCPSVLVASRNDPWMRLTSAAWWADRWGSRFVNQGMAGHINAEAGFGPWPAGLQLLHALQASQSGMPLGNDDDALYLPKGRGGHLSRLRHHTRLLLERQRESRVF